MKRATLVVVLILGLVGSAYAGLKMYNRPQNTCTGAIVEVLEIDQHRWLVVTSPSRHSTVIAHSPECVCYSETSSVKKCKCNAYCKCGKNCKCTDDNKCDVRCKCVNVDL